MRLFYLFFLLLLTQQANTQSVDTLLLYPNGAPDALGKEAKDIPTLMTYFAPKEKATGAAVMICPGGGYANLAMDHEGVQIAEWYNSLGIHAFILKYRLGKWDGSGYQHPTMLNDAKRGFRMIRANAEKWGIDPHRIGIMGFSAGGHLASTLATHFDNGNPESDDLFEQVSCLPNFLVLGYPVISFQEYAHNGSRRFLLGPTPTMEQVENLSNHKQVSVLTPPTFLFHTNEDRGVPPENSVLFYLALREKNIPAELHIYEKGRHGVGFADDDPILSTWKDRLKDWLGHRGALR